jgi:hypothetical protein
MKLAKTDRFWTTNCAEPLSIKERAIFNIKPP